MGLRMSHIVPKTVPPFLALFSYLASRIRRSLLANSSFITAIVALTVYHFSLSDNHMCILRHLFNYNIWD